MYIKTYINSASRPNFQHKEMIMLRVVHERNSGTETKREV